jgi:hypothetical protein
MYGIAGITASNSFQCLSHGRIGLRGTQACHQRWAEAFGMAIEVVEQACMLTDGVASNWQGPGSWIDILRQTVH